MIEANLTRFGPKTFEREQGAPTEYSAPFRAIDGPAKLVIRNAGIDDVSIVVNGVSVVQPQGARADAETVVPLNLKRENTIEVTFRAGAAASCGLRVTQVTRADLGLQRQGYFGLNTSDMARQRAFYETLGSSARSSPQDPRRAPPSRGRSASRMTI
jgi:hypothetical protein